MQTIGFIGVGLMGKPMALNLVKAGHTVKVYDASAKAIDNAASQGAVAAKSIAETVQDCDVVFTMVQTGEQVKAICYDDDGIFQSLKKNALYIDCSTIDITECREIHTAAEQRNIAMLEAPVSGGVKGAEATSLTFMVGGEEALFQKAKPLLEKMGKKIFYAGASGNGQVAKICNNLLLGISMIGVSEAFNLAKKLGLNPKKFFEISSVASGQCWSMTSYCPVPDVIENVPANNEYKPGFMAKMLLKDLHLAQHAAEKHQAAIPLGAEAAELYTLFVNQGHGDLDFSAIIKMLGK